MKLGTNRYASSVYLQQTEFEGKDQVVQRHIIVWFLPSIRIDVEVFVFVRWIFFL